jgi:hypothetical protein
VNRRFGGYGIRRGVRSVRRAGGELSTPADLGATHWYNGDTIADTAGAVTNWADAVASLDFSAVAGDPQVGTGGGGAKYVEFDGTGDYISMGAAVAFTRPLTVGIVFRVNAFSGNDFLLTADSSRFLLISEIDEFLLVSDSTHDGQTANSSIVINAVNYAVVTFDEDASQNTIRLNGVEVTAADAAVGALPNAAWRIGAFTNGSSLFIGRTYDLSFFDSTRVAGADLASLETYLADVASKG